MEYLILAGLVAGALALIVLEFLIPSGGLLGAGSVCAVLGSLWYAQREFQTLGVAATLGVYALATPGIVRWGLNRLKLKSTLTAEGSADHAMLLGREGTALTSLRPAGMVDIAGLRVDAVAENVMIDKGALVKIVKVEGNRVVVRGK